MVNMSRRNLGALMLTATAGIGLAPTAAQAAIQSTSGAVNAATASASGVPAAAAVLTRWLGYAANYFDLSLIPQVNGLDTFTVSASGGRVNIKGSSPATILKGFHEYLNRAMNQDISWNFANIGVPARYPDIAEFTVTSNVKHRFVNNDTEDGYAGAYRNFDEWKSIIDQYAFHGINEVFMPVGSEAVYYYTFLNFGYTKEELLRWIPQAAHQPWWLLQNMSGNLVPLTEAQIYQRADLGRKIVKYIHDLGMRAVLPGFFGTVPPGWKTKHPGESVIPQGTWTSYQRPDWYYPTNAGYSALSNNFYANSEWLIGYASMYKMDLLHEGGTSGGLNVSDQARALERHLQAMRPGATWVLLGWVNNPTQAITSVVNKDTTFIVDGVSERYSRNREADWNNVPYAFGAIWNFGGHNTIGGQLTVWNTRYYEWLKKTGSAMKGLALLPESSYNNSTAFEFMARLAWRNDPADMTEWFKSYVKRRYGSEETHAVAAWDIMRQTAFGYSMAADGVDTSEPAEGLFNGEPSLTRTSMWGPNKQRYDMDKFATALPELLQTTYGIAHTSPYQYDLMDVSRQVLSNLSRVLLPKIRVAYDNRNLTNFDKTTALWLEIMDQIDTITATCHQNLLGRWIYNARAAGTTDAEKAANEKDVRSIISLWSPNMGSLNDYANREWNGLMGGYYKARWSAYFKHLRNNLTGVASTAPNWSEMGLAFVNGTGAYEPVGGYRNQITGDILTLAPKVMETYNKVKALP